MINTTIKKYLGALSFFLLVVYFVSHYQLHQVSGNSMQPTYENHDLVIVKKETKIKRYDVIAFSNSDGSEMYIKRVIGLPGDYFLLQGNKLVLNIEQEGIFNTNFSYTLSEDARAYFTNQTQIPAGFYFVIGDNIAVSKDSRSIGMIKKARIEGVVQRQI